MDAPPNAITTTLTEGDARDPALFEVAVSQWVVVPALQAAMALPKGWIRLSSEQRAANMENHLPQLAGSGLVGDSSILANLRRTKAINVLEHHPSEVSGPVSTVTVQSLGFRADRAQLASLCDSTVVTVRRVFPDVALLSNESTTILGFPAQRCAASYTMTTNERSSAVRVDLYAVAGEQSVVQISFARAATVDDSVLQSVVASLRRLPLAP